MNDICFKNVICLTVCPSHFSELLSFLYLLPWFLNLPPSILCQELGTHPRFPSTFFNHLSLCKSDHLPPKCFSYASTPLPLHCHSWVQKSCHYLFLGPLQCLRIKLQINAPLLLIPTLYQCQTNLFKLSDRSHDSHFQPYISYLTLRSSDGRQSLSGMAFTVCAIHTLCFTPPHVTVVKWAFSQCPCDTEWMFVSPPKLLY